MAIVTKTGSDAPKWEEFVTIKLSKREAAGVLALMEHSTFDVTPYSLYDELDEAVGGLNRYADIKPTGASCKEATIKLNQLYGSL